MLFRYILRNHIKTKREFKTFYKKSIGVLLEITSGNIKKKKLNLKELVNKPFVTVLVENSSYGRRYGRHRGHVTSRDHGSVYNFSRCCLPFPFLFFSFRSLFIDNPII